MQGGLPAAGAPPSTPGLPGQFSPNAYPGGGVRIGPSATTPVNPNPPAPPEPTPGVLSQIGNFFTQPTGETLTPRALPSPSVSGILGAMPWLNPAGRAAIAAGGAMSATPAETGELPLSGSGARPMHPPSTGRMPPQFRGPASPVVNGPVWGNDISVGQKDVTPRSWPLPPRRPANLGAPQGNPSQTPRPATAPNLGYYAPQTGNAQAARYIPYTDPNDPRIYRGPGALWR
jgi:hypothetical protein